MHKDNNKVWHNTGRSLKKNVFYFLWRHKGIETKDKQYDTVV